MVPVSDWLPLALVGLTFTLLGSAKLYGLWRGVVGGKGRTLAQQLCGT